MGLTLLSGNAAAATAASGANETVIHSCGLAPAGQVTCDAELVANKRTRRPVHVQPKKTAMSSSATQPGNRAHVAVVQTAFSSGVVAAPQPMTPAYLQAAYDFTALAASAGYGDTVAIVDVGNDPWAESDMATFRSTFGLPACTSASGCFRKVNEYGNPHNLPAKSDDWISEESLDIDAVSAICPHCRILLVEMSTASIADAQTAIQEAAALGADQISASFSSAIGGDPFWNLGAVSASIVAATGDNGVDSVGTDSYPAADPNVVAVGGTTLVSSTAGAAGARGVTEHAWSSSGAGCDTAVSRPSFQPASSCAGRQYADVSADADPNTGMNIYDWNDGGWMVAGGTSLATPIVAAGEALLGVSSNSASWVYSDNALNPVRQSGCSTVGQILCAGVANYNGRSGMGSISGAAVVGAPGIALPAYGSSGSDVVSTTSNSVLLSGGIYPNSQQTTYYWQYGTTTGYGRTTAGSTLAAGTAPAFATSTVNGLQANVTYHYRLVASNASGTVYGPDYSFTTSKSAAQIRAQVKARARARAAAAKRRREAKARQRRSSRRR